MKKISVALILIMLCSAFVMPSAATSVFTEGEVIYAENFDAVPDTDDLSIIEATLGYKVIVADKESLAYTATEKNESTTIKYSIQGGKLYIDFSEKQSSTYSYLMVYDDAVMNDLVKTTYTVQYEISYLATPAYCSPILNWDGAFVHQVPMFRGNGTYRNQVRFVDSEGKLVWKDWDGMSGIWLPTAVTISETDTVQNVVVRLVSVPDEGIYIYANDYLVSAPDKELASAPAEAMPGAMTSSAVGIRTQTGASAIIDNFVIYAGDGSKFTPDLTAYGMTGLPPVTVVTEADTTEAETTAAPVVTTEEPIETTEVPDETTAAPGEDATTSEKSTTETTEPDNTTSSSGCGSSVAFGAVVLAALLPAAIVIKKRK